MDVLISVNDGMSLAVIADKDYPIVEITTEVAIIAASNRSSASSISQRTGGELIETPLKEFPYEVHINLQLFDRVIEVDKWSDIINKYFSDN